PGLRRDRRAAGQGRRVRHPGDGRGAGRGNPGRLRRRGGTPRPRAAAPARGGRLALPLRKARAGSRLTASRPSTGRPRMKTPAVLAIDQGTTGSTCLVISSDGRVLGRAYSEFTQHFPRPGWVEHDALEILDVTLRVAREALAATPETRAADVRAVGI